MKQGLLVIILALLCGKSSAVSVDSFYRQGVKWAIAQYYLGSQHNPTISSGRVYEVTGDSTIGAYTYHLIHQHATYAPANGLIGGVRTDSGKVWFLSMHQDTMYVRANYASSLTFAFFAPGSEHLLYDYGVHVGDTVKWKCPTNNVVKKIDSIKVDGIWLHRIYFLTGTFPLEEFWVEGIGSNLGFFGAYDNANGPTIGGGVMQHTFRYCAPQYAYEFSQMGPYAGAFGTGCDLKPLGVGEELNNQHEVSVYPNPGRDGMMYVEARGARRITSVTITDITGRAIYQEDFSMTVAKKIALPKLVPGLYVASVILDNGAIVVKKLMSE